MCPLIPKNHMKKYLQQQSKLIHLKKIYMKFNIKE